MRERIGRPPVLHEHFREMQTQRTAVRRRGDCRFESLNDGGIGGGHAGAYSTGLLDHERALFLAQNYVDLARPERALKVLEKASPVDARTWLLRANALMNLERFQEALESARRGLAIDAESHSLHLALARAEMGLGHVAEAEAAVKEALRVAPDDAESHAMHALILATTGRGEAAERVSGLARSLAPEGQGVRFTEAFVALTSGRSYDADPQSAALVADAPEDASVHWLRGMVLLHRPWGPKALWHLREAARLEPSNHEFARAARAVGHWFFAPIRVTGAPVAIAATTRVIAAATGLLSYMFGLLEPKYFWIALAVAIYVNVTLGVVIVAASPRGKRRPRE